MKSPLETQSQLNLIKGRLLLPVLLDILQADIQQLHTSTLKMRELYISQIGLIQIKLTQDIADLRKQLKYNHIELYHEEQTTRGIEAAYTYYGYQRKYAMLWSYLYAEAEEYLDSLIKRSDPSIDFNPSKA